MGLGCRTPPPPFFCEGCWLWQSWLLIVLISVCSTGVVGSCHRKNEPSVLPKAWWFTWLRLWVCVYTIVVSVGVARPGFGNAPVPPPPPFVHNLLPMPPSAPEPHLGLLPLGTAVKSAKGNVTEGLCVLCCSAAFALWGIKGSIHHSHPTTRGLGNRLEGTTIPESQCTVGLVFLAKGQRRMCRKSAETLRGGGHTQPPPPTNKARTWSITKGPRPHAPTPTRRPPHMQQPRPHLHTT